MRFGIVHRMMTDALATLGILAVVSTASMSPWTSAFLIVSLIVCLAIPEGWASSAKTPDARARRDMILRRFGTIAPVALCLVQGTRLVPGPFTARRGGRVRGSAADHPPRHTAGRRARPADHRPRPAALRRGHGPRRRPDYGLCFLGFLVVAPGALVLSHLRREVEGNYRQGARDRTGCPSTCRGSSAAAASSGAASSRHLPAFVPIFIFTASLFVLFPRVGLSLLLLNHPHAGRMVGFSDHVDLGQVGVLRTRPLDRAAVRRCRRPAPARRRA